MIFNMKMIDVHIIVTIFTIRNYWVSMKSNAANVKLYTNEMIYYYEVLYELSTTRAFAFIFYEKLIYVLILKLPDLRV